MASPEVLYDVKSALVGEWQSDRITLGIEEEES